jgi:hypothetical protein
MRYVSNVLENLCCSNSLNNIYLHVMLRYFFQYNTCTSFKIVVHCNVIFIQLLCFWCVCAYLICQ